MTLGNPYETLIEVLVYKDNILHNLRQFQRAYRSVKFAPVIKSNGYGHGLVEIGKILDGQGSPFFMVNSIFEACELRKAKIKTPLLVLGYCTTESINNQKLRNISFGIISLDQLKDINRKIIKPVVFHLKIDTGMRRQGLLPQQLDEAVKIIQKNKFIKVEGMSSHLADADGDTDEFSHKQIALWNSLAKKLPKELPSIKYKHLSNSAGADLNGKIDSNIGRLGISLYGYNFSPRNPLNLKPALEMRSVISSIRKLKKGEKIGYNITFTAPKNMNVATVAGGYHEGLDRRLSSKGFMMVGKTVCPILGRVSMNITSIDISKVSNPRLDMPVTIMSKNPKDPNSVDNIAKLCHTIPYEILVKIPQYLKRVII